MCTNNLTSHLATICTAFLYEQSLYPFCKFWSNLRNVFDFISILMCAPTFFTSTICTYNFCRISSLL